jgi:hypothetical protein
VFADGTLVRGSRAVSSSISQVGGIYTVTFDQNVDSCAYLATLDGDASSGEIMPSHFVSGPAVTVQTFTPSGNPAPHTFHLAVLC